MAYQAKTTAGSSDIAAFLAAVTPPARQAEAARLVEVFSEVTGYAPRLWAGSMVGFGRYDYRYASGHAGSSLATGFAPRKAEISVYVLPGYQDYGAILARLGPHRTGKSCLYLRHLDRIDEGALRDLIAAGLEDLRKLWPVFAE